MSNDSKVSYPPVGFYFKVEFNFSSGEIHETSFKEVSGLNTNLSPDFIEEGGELRFRHKLPTQFKYQNLILKRGLIPSSEVRNWIVAGVRDFKFTPIILTIQLLNEKGSPLMTWEVNNAWPVKWEVSQFNSESKEIVIESLELAYDYFSTKNS